MKEVQQTFSTTYSYLEKVKEPARVAFYLDLKIKKV
jgi:hypothetical protein